MPLFRIYNFDKAGKGVSKDEPEKKGLAGFFSVFGSHITRMMQLNLLFMLPLAVVLALCVVLFILPVTRYDLVLVRGAVTYHFSLWNFYVVTAPLVLLFPFFAGLTYATRNFARREHVFIYMDSKEVVMKNWKAFLLHGLLTYVGYVLLSFADIYYYLSLSESWFYVVPFAICVLITLVFLFVLYYVPVMIVTFDLKLRQIYRNALIFSVLGIKGNIVITAVLALFLYIAWQCLTYSILTVLLLGLFMLLLGFSFFGLLVNYCVYPVLEKYLIIPYYGTQDTPAQAAASDDQPADETPQEPQKPSEYVYYNGRLMKRSDLEKREEDTVFKETL